MNKLLLKELITDLTIEDIPEQHRPIVDMIGIENYVKLSQYSKGTGIYFIRPENLVVPARNRKICNEFNGYNLNELAGKYDLTTRQIRNIINDVPIPGQISLSDLEIY